MFVVHEFLEICCLDALIPFEEAIKVSKSSRELEEDNPKLHMHWKDRSGHRNGANTSVT